MIRATLLSLCSFVMVACSDASMSTADAPAMGDASTSRDSGSGSGSDSGSDGSTSATCDSKTAQPLDATWTLTVGSLTRKANVHVPASYQPNQRTPIVINLHGRGSSATQQALLTFAGSKSDAEGFIVIHPDSATASLPSWNAGDTCCDPAVAEHVDDVGFIRALLDEAEAKLCVDTSRVYAMGMSNGGYLSNRLGCEMADRIAAIGSVTGILEYSACAPTKPMPVMMVMGTADPIVSYSWVPATVTAWKTKNQCTTQMQTYQNGVVTCVTHGGCTGGADVVLCSVQDGGHQWPGGLITLPLLGNKTDDISATDALWDFFVAHPRL